MASKKGQSTDHMNQGGGMNASGGSGKSPTSTKSDAFRSMDDRTTDNNDYKRNIPHGQPVRRP